MTGHNGPPWEEENPSGTWRVMGLRKDGYKYPNFGFKQL